MLVELYMTFFRLSLEYGEFETMLVAAFMTSLAVFAVVGVTTLVTRKSELKPWWFFAFVLTQLYLFIGQTALAFWYSVEIPTFLFFEPATYTFIVLVLPLTLVYHKVMEKYPILPWHVMQYIFSLLGSLVLWYLLVYFFAVFQFV